MTKTYKPPGAPGSEREKMPDVAPGMERSGAFSRGVDPDANKAVHHTAGATSGLSSAAPLPPTMQSTTPNSEPPATTTSWLPDRDVQGSAGDHYRPRSGPPRHVEPVVVAPVVEAPNPYDERLKEMEAATATHEDRKVFYGNGGSNRAIAMIAELDALRGRAAVFVRSD